MKGNRSKRWQGRRQKKKVRKKRIEKRKKKSKEHVLCNH